MVGIIASTAFNLATFGYEEYARKMEGMSNLPGSSNGPADAYRHITRAAAMTLALPDSYVESLLNIRERLGGTTNSAMDYHNNAIGMMIGKHIKENGGDLKDVQNLVEKAIKESMNVPMDKWEAHSGGIYFRTDDRIELEEDFSVMPIALTSPSEWSKERPSPSQGGMMFTTK